MKQNLFYIIFVVAIAGGILHFQNSLTMHTSSLSWKAEDLTYIPSSDRLRPALLGFDVTVSHWLWIQTVIYFGSHYMTDKNYAWLIKMVDIVTRLNPSFYPAYEFAGVIIPETCHNPDAARVILQRGFSHLGATKWNVGFYLGMLYYNYYGEKKIAADYIRLASLAAAAPVEKLVPLSSAFYSQAGEAEVGIELLRLTIESSQNPEVRRYLSDKVQSMLRNRQQ